MRISHKVIDYISVALFLFNSVLLGALFALCFLRSALQIPCSDEAIVCIAVCLAVMVTRKPAICALSRFLHRVFRFDI